jgi:hypothetical protein
MRALVAAAVSYARDHGARLIEAYPIDLNSERLVGRTLTGDGGFTGVASVFSAEGFQEAAQASDTQLVMRRAIRAARST